MDTARSNRLSAKLEKAKCLAFNSADDALDFGAKLVERGNDWLAANDLNVAERYVKGSLNIVVKYRASTQAHVFDLVFRRMPSAIADLRGRKDLSSGAAKFGKAALHSERDEQAMRVGIPYSVQGPQHLIASLVWLEPHQERSDFRRDILKSSAAQFTFDACDVPREREAGILWGTISKADGTCISGMVESIAQIAGGVLENGGEASGKVGSQPDFVDVLAGITVKIDNTSAWLSLKEGSNSGVQVLGVLACALD